MDHLSGGQSILIPARILKAGQNAPHSRQAERLDVIPRPCPRRTTTAVQRGTLPGIYAQHHVLLPGGLCKTSFHQP